MPATRTMKYRNLPAGVTQRRAQANGIFLDYLESGTPGSPLIVLLHGWPETCWSWRHQLKPLADAGYHVIAPDQRGYGGSTVPRTPEAYAGDILAADVLALVDHVKNQTGGKAIFVGHDWGALLLWHLARLHPERVEAAIIVSVPLFDPPVPPIAQFKKIHEDRFFYILHFQVRWDLDADR